MSSIEGGSSVDKHFPRGGVPVENTRSSSEQKIEKVAQFALDTTRRSSSRASSTSSRSSNQTQAARFDSGSDTEKSDAEEGGDLNSQLAQLQRTIDSITDPDEQQEFIKELIAKNKEKIREIREHLGMKNPSVFVEEATRLMITMGGVINAVSIFMLASAIITPNFVEAKLKEYDITTPMRIICGILLFRGSNKFINFMSEIQNRNRSLGNT